MLPYIILGLLAFMESVEGHGRLLEPPSRASMWRVGFDNPADYNDNQGFCGGLSYQMSQGGKCGICGDPWLDSPKAHEAPGGMYANGIITRTYNAGQDVQVDVQITANHKGYFEFKLCANNDFENDKDQSCFDENLLEVVNGEGNKFYIGNENKHYKPIVRLPAGLTCSQCTLQWTYVCGNNWGTDPVTGESGMGVNPLQQEHFRACSDIAITGSEGPVNPGPEPTTPEPTTTTTPAPEPTTAPPAPQPTTTSNGPDEPGTECHAVGIWAGNGAMDSWCETNCNWVPKFCPPNYCSCE